MKYKEILPGILIGILISGEALSQANKNTHMFGVQLAIYMTTGQNYSESDYQETEYFFKDSCNKDRVKSFFIKKLISYDFLMAHSTIEQKVHAAYMGALGVEPDRSILSKINEYSEIGRIDKAIDYLWSHKRADKQVSIICSDTKEWGAIDSNKSPNQSYINDRLSYPINTFNGNSIQQLQSKIDSRPKNSTLYLKQGHVILATEPLTLNRGINIETFNFSKKMLNSSKARIVRAGSYWKTKKDNALDNVMIVSDGQGISIKNIVIDGNATEYDYDLYSHSVESLSRSGSISTQIDSVDFVRTAGWTNLHSYGLLDNVMCSSISVKNSLFDLSLSNHIDYGWSDGLSLNCDNILIDNVKVFNAQDVGIVIFANDRDGKIKSTATIKNTKIMNFGGDNSQAYGGIVVDPLITRHYITGTAKYDLTIENTQIVSKGTGIHCGLCLGTGMWFDPSISRIGSGIVKLDGLSFIGHFDTAGAVSNYIGDIDIKSISYQPTSMEYLELSHPIKCKTKTFSVNSDNERLDYFIQKGLVPVDDKHCMSH